MHLVYNMSYKAIYRSINIIPYFENEKVFIDWVTTVSFKEYDSFVKIISKKNNLITKYMNNTTIFMGSKNTSYYETENESELFFEPILFSQLSEEEMLIFTSTTYSKKS